MMKAILKVVPFILFICISWIFPSFGTCPDGNVNGTGKVQKVLVEENGNLRVKFDWSKNSLILCNLDADFQGGIPVKANACHLWMTYALTAKSSDQNISFEHTFYNNGMYKCNGDWGVNDLKEKIDDFEIK